MKRLLFFSILLLFLSGCSWNKFSSETVGNDGRLTLVYNDGFYTIIKDNETGVQYLSRSHSGTCVMVDVDGKPLVDK